MCIYIHIYMYKHIHTLLYVHINMMSDVLLLLIIIFKLPFEIAVLIEGNGTDP